MTKKSVDPSIEESHSHLAPPETPSEAAVEAAPRRGAYYRVQPGDSLLGVAGRAYGVPAGEGRLVLARKLNRHPLNQRYERGAPSSLFPEGPIALLPRYSCDDNELVDDWGPPARGNCHAVLWIPPEGDFDLSGLGPALELPASLLTKLLARLERARAEAAEFTVTPPTASEHLRRGALTRVPNSSTIPARFICSVISVFPHPKITGVHLLGGGSGTLIGHRHVLTAAHVVLQDPWGDGSLLLRAQQTIVTPASDGPSSALATPGERLPMSLLSSLILGRSPLGSFVSGRYAIPDRYRRLGPTRHLYDYGLIRLPLAVARRPWRDGEFGYWSSSQWGGRTLLIPRQGNLQHEDQKVCLSGYPTQPIGEHGLTQWLSCGRVRNVELPVDLQVFEPDRQRLGYMAQPEDGHSGSPVWHGFDIDGRRWRQLLAVHSDGGFGIQAASGVLLTESVLADIRRWRSNL